MSGINYPYLRNMVFVYEIWPRQFLQENLSRGIQEQWNLNQYDSFRVRDWTPSLYLGYDISLLGSLCRPSRQDIHIHHHADDPEGQREAREARQNTLIKIIGVIAVAVFSFVTARSYKAFKGYSKELDIIRRDKEQVAHLEEVNANLYNIYSQIVGKREQIAQERYSCSRNYLIASVSFLTSAALAVVGAVASSSLLLVAGCVAGVAGLILAFVNLGLHWDDQKEHGDLAREMLSLQNRLNINPEEGEEGYHHPNLDALNQLDPLQNQRHG